MPTDRARPHLLARCLVLRDAPHSLARLLDVGVFALVAVALAEEPGHFLLKDNDLRYSDSQLGRVDLGRGGRP